jgi:catechol 2,3-dioxygenase-like lactoylglutathione lyase family enzyme
MISYVTLGTNDFDAAVRFYDELLGPLGASRMFEEDRMVYWGRRPGAAMLAIAKPWDGEEATVGNGTMVALGVRSTEIVDETHRRALALGARDEGAPGFRTGPFYGAYFRDLDGNKLCIFCMKEDNDA